LQRAYNAPTRNLKGLHHQQGVSTKKSKRQAKNVADNQNATVLLRMSLHKIDENENPVSEA